MTVKSKKWPHCRGETDVSDAEGPVQGSVLELSSLVLCGPPLLSSPSLLILKTPAGSFICSYWSWAWVSSFAYRVTPASTHPPTTIDRDHWSNNPLTTGSGKLIGSLRKEQKDLLASSLRDASQQGNMAIFGISPWLAAFSLQFSSFRFRHCSRLSYT